ncbi:hypothetical protein LINPERHAP2_LOCUS36817, partial [Linum perenne]
MLVRCIHPIHGFGIQRKAHIRHEDLQFPAWVLGAPSSIQSIMVHIHLIPLYRSSYTHPK